MQVFPLVVGGFCNLLGDVAVRIGTYAEVSSTNYEGEAGRSKSARWTLVQATDFIIENHK